jgi:hypothetical protein
MVTIPKWVDYYCFNHIRLFGGETDDEALELKVPDFQTDLHADQSMILSGFIHQNAMLQHSILRN